MKLQAQDPLTQDLVVEVLASNGFNVDSTSEFDDGVTVFMSKRVNRHSTRYVEVDSQCNCNGIAPQQFFAQLSAFLK